MLRRVTPLAMLLLLALPPTRAHAQKSSVDNKAAAEALFDHAKRLHAAGQYAEACPKFAESQKLDAGIGTLLYLADCYEKNGQTASAWAGFREAAAAAKVANQPERERIARDRASSLEPSLSRLTITVEPANVIDGVEVTRNGVPIGKALWGTAIPVDPGSHKIEARAAGKKPWSGKVDVGKVSASADIHIPRLEDEAPAPVTPPAQTDSSGAMSAQRVVGIILLGVGVAGAAVGTVFGVQAMSKDDEADTHCRASNRLLCTEEGVILADQAETAALVSTIAFGAGGAALVGGAIVFFTAPSNAASSPAVGLRAAPAIGKSSGGLLVRGSF